MQEEWASKSSRVQRERVFREARIAARNAKMTPQELAARADPSTRTSKLRRRAAMVVISLVGVSILYWLTVFLDRALDGPRVFWWQ